MPVSTAPRRLINAQRKIQPNEPRTRGEDGRGSGEYRIEHEYTDAGCEGGVGTECAREGGGLGCGVEGDCVVEERGADAVEEAADAEGCGGRLLRRVRVRVRVRWVL